MKMLNNKFNKSLKKILISLLMVFLLFPALAVPTSASWVDKVVTLYKNDGTDVKTTLTMKLSGSLWSGYYYDPESVTLTNPFVRYGYYFAGWATKENGEVKYDETKSINYTDSFYAIWTPVSYSISYTNLQGATVDNKTSYNIETETFTLNNPSREGYDFDGWTWDGQSTPVKNVTIEKGSTGARTYTANWKETAYNDISQDYSVLSLDTYSYVYDGNIHQPTVTLKIKGKTIDSQYYDISYSGNSTDAGTHTIIVTGKEGYTGTKSIDYTITKVTSIVSVSANDLTYTGSPQALVNVQSNAKQTIKYKVRNKYLNLILNDSTNCEVTDAGTYYVYYKVDDNNNYSGIDYSWSSIEVTIKQRDINDVITGVSVSELKYTGSEQSPSITVHTANGDLDSSNYDISCEVRKDAGSYSLTITGKGNYTGEKDVNWSIENNYDISVATVNYTNEYTYTGSKFIPQVEVSMNGSNVALASGIDYTVTYSDPNSTNAGTYTITISGNGNYMGQKVVSYTINKADCPVTISASNTTYNGSSQQLVNVINPADQTIYYYVSTDKYSTLFGSNKLESDFDSNKSIDCKRTGADTYYVYYKVVENNNYKGNDIDINDYVEVTISKAELTADNFEISTPSVIYDGNEHSVKVVGKFNDIDLVEGTDYTIVNGSILSATHAGTYKIYITTIGSDNGNFKNQILELTKSWTIEKENIDNQYLTIEVEDFEYDGTKSDVGSDYIVVEYKGKPLTILLDYTLGNIYEDGKDSDNNQKYSVTIYTTDSSNFYGSTKTTIIQKPNVVTVTELANNNFVYDGELHDLIENAECIHGTIWYAVDDGLWSTVIPQRMNAGSYTVNYKVYDTIYYKGFSSSTVVHIAPKEITSVTVNGSYTYDSVTQTVLDYVVKSENTELKFINGDYKVLSGDSGKNAGSYILEVEGTGNYTGTATTTWLINKKDLSSAKIVLDDIYTYNGSSITCLISSVYVGLIPVTTNDYEIVEGTDEGLNAGNYTLKIKATENGNFTGEASETWTIKKAIIQVNGNNIELANSAFSANDLTYNGSSQSVLTTKTNLVYDTEHQTIYFRVNEGAWQTTIPELIDAGTYKIGYKIETTSGSSNYADFGAFIADPIWVTIKQYKLTAANFKLSTSTFIYNSFSHSVSVTGKVGDTELVEGQDYNIVDESVLSKKDAGTYTVLLTTIASESGNYTNDLLELQLTWQILPKEITTADFTVECVDALYSGQSLDAADYVDKVYFYNNEYKCDVLLGNSAYNVINSAYTDCGTYSVTIEANSDNYKGSATFNNVFNIKIADLALEYSVPSLTYNAGNQALLNAVTVTRISDSQIMTGFTINYSVDNGETWSDSIPQVDDAGTYTVLYKVLPGSVEDHYYVGCEGKIKAVIQPAEITTITCLGSYTYNGRQQSLNYVVKAGELTLDSNDYYINGYVTGTDASTYTFKVTGKGNFTGSIDNNSWVIEKKNISDANIYLNPLYEYIYNGSTLTCLISYVSVDFLPVTYDIKDHTNEGINAGTYTLLIEGNGNFTGTATKLWEIQKAVIRVDDYPIEALNSAYIANNFVFDGTSHTALVTKTNIEGLENKVIYYYIGYGKWYDTLPEILDAEWVDTMPEIINAGKYTVWYKIVTKDGESSNYQDFGTVVPDPVHITVTPKRLTPDDFSLSFEVTTYTGLEQCVNVIGQVGSITLIENQDFVVINKDASSQTDVGSYVVSLMTTATEFGNFTCESFKFDYLWQIVPAEVKLDYSDSELTYNGSSQTLLSSVTVLRLPGNESVDLEVKYSLDNDNWSTSIPEATDAGTYTIYYKIASDTNHLGREESATVLINKAQLTKENFTITFDDTAEAGTVQVVKVAGKFNGFTLIEETDYTATVSVLKEKNVWHYTVTIKTDCSSNFETSEFVFDEYWYMGKPLVNVTAHDLIYNARNQVLLDTAESASGTTLTYLLSKEQLTDPDSVEGWTTVVPQAKDAGTYYVYYHTLETNECISVGGSCTVIINPYDISSEKITLLGGYALHEQFDDDQQPITQTQLFECKVIHSLAGESDIVVDLSDYLVENSNVGAMKGDYKIIIVGTGNYTGRIEKLWDIISKENDNIEDYLGSFTVLNNSETITISSDNKEIMSSVASPEDISAIMNGMDLQLIVESEKVSDTVIEEIKQEIEETAGEYEVAAYVDISLWKQYVQDGNYVDGSKSQVFNTNKKIKLAIPIDESLINTDSEYERVYKIVRVHETDSGVEYELLDATYDAENKVLIVESDKFSYFAIVYKDVAVTEEDEFSFWDWYRRNNNKTHAKTTIITVTTSTQIVENKNEEVKTLTMTAPTFTNTVTAEGAKISTPVVSNNANGGTTATGNTLPVYFLILGITFLGLIVTLVLHVSLKR